MSDHRKSRFFFTAVAYFLYAEPLWSRVSCLTCQFPYLKEDHLVYPINWKWYWHTKRSHFTSGPTNVLHQTLLISRISHRESVHPHQRWHSRSTPHTTSLLCDWFTVLWLFLSSLFSFPSADISHLPLASCHSFVCLPAGSIQKSTRPARGTFIFPSST